jgi:DNA processing protein
MISSEDIIRMQQVQGLGRKTISKILEYIELKNIDIKDFSEIEKLVKDLGIKKIKFEDDEIEKRAYLIFESCKKNNIRIISLYDESFPERLRSIEDKPLILYLEGNEKLLENGDLNIAIVGTRTPTQKGYEISSILAEKLAGEGRCIVSGLAFGCDEAAHTGCLAVKGKTIAVIPSGCRNIQKGSKILYNRIILNGGAVISELPPDAKSEKHTFIERNRIITAISDGIIVIEGGRKGGTSHTVKYANLYGKPVAYTDESFENNEQNIFSKDMIHIVSNFKQLKDFIDFVTKNS